MLDLLISGGLLVDPETKTSFYGDLGVLDGKIVQVGGEMPQAARTLDASGLVVCPGLIDVHAHVDGISAYKDVEGCARLSLLQGVTALVSGNCGASVQDVGAFFRRMDQGFPVHQAELMGHSALRKAVGLQDIFQPATPEQIQRMDALLKAALDKGAAGVSFGLGYVPGTSMEEVLSAARLVAQYGRVVSVDTQMEDNYDLHSLQDAIDVGRSTGARMLISHFVYQYGQGVIEEALEMVQRARAEGVDIWADSGMYVDWATTIGSECFRESFVFSHCCQLPMLLVATGKYAGRSLDIDLYREMRTLYPKETVICRTGWDESIYPPFDCGFVMPSSDTAPYDKGEGHPQIAGSFAGFFRMARETGRLSLEEAVYRATLLPAKTFGFGQKGRLSVGADADICAFDFERIQDRASYVDKGRPDAPPEGVEHVLLDGQVALAYGKLENQRLGHALRCLEEEA